MFFHKSLLAALLVGASIGFALSAHCEALDDIVKAKVIRVAVPQDFAPFGSAGLDLKPQGYDIDMANLIGKELGVRVEIIPVTSANRIPYLQTRKADIVISSLGKTAEREKVIDFSNAYAPFFSGVFGAKAVPVSKIDDLAGKTVGATRGAIEEQELTKMAPPTTTVKRFEDNNTTIAAFISCQVDLIATGNVVAAAIAEKSPARVLGEMAQGAVAGKFLSPALTFRCYAHAGDDLRA
jgi:polar amino acid transport system substrate-binding protein